MSARVVWESAVETVAWAGPLMWVLLGQPFGVGPLVAAARARFLVEGAEPGGCPQERGLCFRLPCPLHGELPVAFADFGREVGHHHMLGQPGR
jgi:hypothetical protein